MVQLSVMSDPRRLGFVERSEGSKRSGGSTLSWFVDAAVALLVVVMFWLLSWTTDPTGSLPVTIGMVVVVVAAVLLRWRWPLAAFLVALIVTAAGWALGSCTDPMIAAAWCVYPLALRGGRTRTVGPVAVVLVLCSGILAVTSAGSDLAQRGVLAVGALGAGWLLGRVESRRLAAARQVVEQAAEFERLRAQATMAREVHDVVGHALTVISAEADVARSLPDSDERELRESLADIEQRARGALEEVQALVRALRAGKSGLDAVEAGAASEALPRLVTAARASGLEVAATIDLPEVPLETDRVTVRLVQEALSNVVRHSRASRCEVAVWPEDAALTVRVDDDGTGFPSSTRPGNGLTGMRERVDEAGGELTVTARLDGGTRVLARLPLRRDRDGTDPSVPGRRRQGLPPCLSATVRPQRRVPCARQGGNGDRGTAHDLDPEARRRAGGRADAGW